MSDAKGPPLSPSQSDKLNALGQVAGSIAHEIRSFLHTAKMSVYYLLHAEGTTQDKLREHLLRIDNQINLIDHTVTALSDVARLPEPRVAPVSIEQQIRDALHTISLPEHVQVSVHIPHDLPEILADTHQLLIVLRNLIQNARDAMPHGGKIQFDVSNEERTIRIAVRDEGVGIPPEILHRIGEPFFSTKENGMGLGLSICRAILDRHRGEISFESQVGRGSIVAISLPKPPLDE